MVALAFFGTGFVLWVVAIITFLYEDRSAYKQALKRVNIVGRENQQNIDLVLNTIQGHYTSSSKRLEDIYDKATMLDDLVKKEHSHFHACIHELVEQGQKSLNRTDALELEIQRLKEKFNKINIHLIPKQHKLELNLKGKDSLLSRAGIFTEQ